MIKISDSEFAVLTEYLRSNFGINLIKKRTLIESRLNNYLVKKGYVCFKDYYDDVFSDASGNKISHMVNLLTTNYSYFMREWDHFAFFQSQVLPELYAKVRDKDLRIWSAGCSTGQEPYTLSMVISDFLGSRKPEWDTKVLATDISIKALTAAREGVYNDDSVSNIPAEWKKSYFKQMADHKWQVRDFIKEEIIFRSFNLMENYFPFKRKFHVIFCRNVMIYFNEDAKKILIQKFFNALEEGGYLFIGQSESINKSGAGFQYVRPAIYKKVVQR